jgi:hypothetical protein
VQFIGPTLVELQQLVTERGLESLKGMGGDPQASGVVDLGHDAIHAIQ